MIALQAAEHAGASYADVRVCTGRTLRIRSEYQPGVSRGRPDMSPPILLSESGYGIRVLVDGVWGFAGGFEMTPEGVQRVAAAAVRRGQATQSRHTVELASAPTIPDGDWTTPIEVSAFDVSMGEQGDFQLEALAAAARVDGVRRALVDFSWQETDRVFASTSGSVTKQRLYTFAPLAFVAASSEEAFSGSAESVESLVSGGYGYEAVTRSKLVSEVGAAAARAVEVSRSLAPPLSFGVGRFDVVLSSRSMINVIGSTLARALDAERVLGFNTNHGGTSYAAPAEAVLGQLQIASPLVSLHADRSRPHGHATVAWDDEGVVPIDTELIRDGIVMDYLTTRETAPQFAELYRRRGDEVRSLGYASGAGQELPTVELPNLTLQAGPEDQTLDDLISGIDRGFYIEQMIGMPDHQLLSAQYSVPTGRAWEIRNGRKVDRAQDLALQFVTPQLWRSLDALGGSDSSEDGTHSTPHAFRRHPTQQWFSSASAPPGRFRNVNILNTGRSE